MGFKLAETPKFYCFGLPPKLVAVLFALDKAGGIKWSYSNEDNTIVLGIELTSKDIDDYKHLERLLK